MEFLINIGGLDLSILEIIGIVMAFLSAVLGGFMKKFHGKFGKASFLLKQVYEAGKAFNEVQEHFVQSLSEDDDTPNKFDAEEQVILKQRWGVFAKELKDIPVAFKDLAGKELPE